MKIISPLLKILNNDNQITNNEYVLETPEEVMYLFSGYQLERGAKRYELTNHLGNVLTVISDKKTANFTGTTFINFTAERISATDYSPFGASLAGRTWNGGEYRYGFNSKEIDLEGMGGGGSTYDYGFRVYNPNLGKFLSVDPLTSSFPWYTPFQFAGNKPIFAIDLDGLEEFVIITQQYRVNGKTFIYRVDFEYIEPDERADGYKSNGSVLFLDNGFNRMLNQRPKVFKKDILEGIISSNRNSICANCSNEKAYIMAKNGQKNGETYKYIFPTKVFSLDNDEGNTLPELESRINSSEVARAAMDEIVGRLYYDPNSKASVLASADPSPTNVDGTKSTTETEHNLELAQQRLQAGVELLKKYYKDTFGVDLADDRILKPTPQTNKDRSISFSISTDQR